MTNYYNWLFKRHNRKENKQNKAN